jgi:hypothetical protein
VYPRGSGAPRRSCPPTAHRERSDADLARIRAEHTEARTEFEAGQADKVEELRENPDELRERMLRAGRGEHR